MALIKFSVFYPYEEGKHFDMDYYVNHHVSPTKDIHYIKKVCVERGISGIESDMKPPFFCVSHLYYETMADFEAEFLPSKARLLDDVKNFTDVTPYFMIGETTWEK